MPSLTLNNKTIGITLGDPAGIGGEITAKALRKLSQQRKCHFIVIGDGVLFKKYGINPSGRLSLIDCHQFDSLNKIPKGISKISGAASLAYLRKANELIKTKKINALVTAPVCKEAIALSDKSFVGHTEFLAKSFGVKNVEMMFVHQNTRVVIATRHIPLKKVPVHLNKEKILGCLIRTNEALKKTFHIRHPHIAVCGLNPHASESGLIGNEENDIIIPALKSARQKGIHCEGPFPADTIFIEKNRKSHDCIVAMYHDQGLTPVKTMYFDSLVNLTVGLPFIRTSPDHGTAFDLAGKNKANPTSMLEAIKLAINLS